MAKFVSVVLTLAFLCSVFLAQSNAAPADAADNKPNNATDITTTEVPKATNHSKTENNKTNDEKSIEQDKTKEVKVDKPEDHPAAQQAETPQPQPANKTEQGNAGVTVFGNYVLFFAGVLFCSRL